MKDRMKLNLPLKLLEKLVWVPFYFDFVKVSFPVTRLVPCLVPYYAETDCSHPLIARL